MVSHCGEIQGAADQQCVWWAPVIGSHGLFDVHLVWSYSRRAILNSLVLLSFHYVEDVPRVEDQPSPFMHAEAMTTAIAAVGLSDALQPSLVADDVFLGRGIACRREILCCTTE